jgi:nucleoside-diphosphate-sugar epimerase
VVLRLPERGLSTSSRQAVAAGVKHISFVGTVSALMDFTSPVLKAPLSDKDWNPLSEEVAVDLGNGTLVYTVAKTQAEKALWKFAEEHPELNLTLVRPRFIDYA